MSTVGICQVCNAAAASHTCEHCGSLVCEQHYDRQQGLCHQCLAGQR